VGSPDVLRDVVINGMTKRPCAAKTTLLLAYTDAVKRHSEAVTALHEFVGVSLEEHDQMHGLTGELHATRNS